MLTPVPSSLYGKTYQQNVEYGGARLFIAFEFIMVENRVRKYIKEIKRIKK